MEEEKNSEYNRLMAESQRRGGAVFLPFFDSSSMVSKAMLSVVLRSSGRPDAHTHLVTQN